MEASERSLRGRIGGYAKAAKYPPDQLTSAARRAFNVDKFEREAREDAERRGESLSDGELHRRAEYLRRKHMAKLALRSAQVRRARSRKAGRS